MTMSGSISLSGRRFQNHFLKLSAVLPRCDIFHFPKTFPEITRVVKSGLISDFRKRQIRAGKQVFGGLYFVMEQILARRLTDKAAENPVELAFGVMTRSSELRGRAQSFVRARPACP